MGKLFDLLFFCGFFLFVLDTLSYGHHLVELSFLI